MKKLYSIRLVMPFLLAFGFSSCVVYSPHNADIPLLYERGQLQIDASASLSAPLLAVPAVNASVAYSPFNHVAVQGAASLSALNSIYAQGAVGTYFPFGNIVLECYAGYGYGYTNIDSIASTTASSGYRINGNYNLYYGQLNLGWAQLLDGYLDLGFGVKGGLLAPNWSRYKLSTDASNQVVAAHTDNHLLIEPQFILRLGGQHLKFTFNLSYAYLRGWPNSNIYLNYERISAALGIHYKF